MTEPLVLEDLVSQIGTCHLRIPIGHYRRGRISRQIRMDYSTKALAAEIAESHRRFDLAMVRLTERPWPFDTPANRATADRCSLAGAPAPPARLTTKS